jgi:hypothetical protein
MRRQTMRSENYGVHRIDSPPQMKFESTDHSKLSPIVDIRTLARISDYDSVRSVSHLSHLRAGIERSIPPIENACTKRGFVPKRKIVTQRTAGKFRHPRACGADNGRAHRIGIRASRNRGALHAPPRGGAPGVKHCNMKWPKRRP